MKHTSFITASALLAALALCAAPASAQSRGHAGGPVMGHAAPRVGVSPRIISPRIISPRFVGGFRPYGFGYPGVRIGLFAGFGYPYGYYGYPYGYGYYGYPYGYGYSYGYGYPYGYSAYGYGYPGYYPPPAGGPGGYVSAVAGHAYGGVRIQSRAHDAQVFADGYYVGIVDDFDGRSQHLNLEAGPHHIEVRPPNAPPIAFDVNVRPGETITYHADVR